MRAMSHEDGASELGGRIRERRQRQGLALKATAKQAGISLQYLSEIERGLKLPTLETLTKVAGALNTTVVKLLQNIDMFDHR